MLLRTQRRQLKKPVSSTRWLAVTVIGFALAITWFDAIGTAVAQSPADHSIETSSEAAGVIPAAYFGMTLQTSKLVPVLRYATTRSWDALPGPDWADSNPSPGVYDFTSLDEFIAANEPSSANGLSAPRDMIYTFGRTPQWASSQPTKAAEYGLGECAPPSNVRYWDDYVTAVVQHAAGRIKYWEVWNEPNNPTYYCGDIPALVTLAQHAKAIIKNLDPAAVILGPGMAGGVVGPEWLSTFLEEGGKAAVDVIAFHGYWDQTAEDLLTDMGNYKAVMVKFGISNLPLWDTEASGKVMPSVAATAAFLSKYYLLHWSAGASRFLWYAYDGAPQWGQLWSAAGGANLAAIAYAQTYDWMVGATMSTPCSKDSANLWTCGFTRAGYEAEALWNSVENATVSVPAQFVQYRDLLGGIHPISDGRVPVGTDPILVETAATESNVLRFAAIPAKTFGNPTFPVFAVSPSNGTITYSVVSGPAALSGSSDVTLTGAGTVVLKASQAASANYKASTTTISFSVAQEVPVIGFTGIAAQTFGASPFNLSLNSVSRGAVTYAVTGGPATVSGATLRLTGAGTVFLHATQAAAGNYAQAETTSSFSVAPAPLTISFAAIPPKAFEDPAFTLAINSPSDGAVAYQLISGRATLSGSSLKLLGAGPIWLRATQAATRNYDSAITKTMFVVGPGKPTLSIDPIPATLFGGDAWARLSSNSSGPVTYSIVSGSATVSRNCITARGVGTVVVKATQAVLGNYTAGTATTSFTVLPKAPILAFTAIAGKTYGGAPFAVSATSASAGQVKYTVVQGAATVSGNMVTIRGAGTIRLQAVQVANGNYTSASATTAFSVAREKPALQIAAIPLQQLSSTPLVVTANSPSSGQVYYSVVSGPARMVSNKVVLTGTGTVHLSALQLAEGNYTTATAAASFSVVASSAGLSFTTVPAGGSGAPSAATQDDIRLASGAD